MKNILLILIVVLGVGCKPSPRSHIKVFVPYVGDIVITSDSPFSKSFIDSLSKASDISKKRFDSSEYWQWARQDTMQIFGHTYDQDALDYIKACGADSILGKYNWRRLDNGDIEYFDKKWIKVVPHGGLTSSTSNDSLVYTMPYPISELDSSFIKIYAKKLRDSLIGGGAIDAVMQDYRKYGLPKHKPIIIPCCDLETPSKPVSKRMWGTPKDCIRVGNLPDTVKPKMGIRGKSKSYYLPRSTMAERLWNKSAQVKNDTLIRIGDNGIEYFDGKKWITIPPVQMPNVTMRDTSDYYLSGDDTIWLNGYREIKIPPSAESLFKGIDTTKKGFSLYMDGGYSSGDTAKIYYNKKKTMQKFKINYGIPGVFTFMPLYDYLEAVDEAGARESFKKEYPTWNIYYVKQCTTKKELEAFHWFMVDKNMSPEEKNKILNDWAKQMDSAGYKPIFNYSQDTIGIGADGIHGNPKSLEHMNKEFEKINHKKRHN